MRAKKNNIFAIQTTVFFSTSSAEIMSPARKLHKQKPSLFLFMNYFCHFPYLSPNLTHWLNGRDYFLTAMKQIFPDCFPLIKGHRFVILRDVKPRTILNLDTKTKAKSKQTPKVCLKKKNARAKQREQSSSFFFLSSKKTTTIVQPNS